jgi:hypothetical protein
MTEQGKLFEARQRLRTHKARRSASFRQQVQAVLSCYAPLTQDRQSDGYKCIKHKGIWEGHQISTAFRRKTGCPIKDA